MKRNGLMLIQQSSDLTAAEKRYICDIQFRMGGSFTKALFEAIARADRWNMVRLARGFPEEVAAYRAWTEGDLYDRACRVAGGDINVIEADADDETNVRL